MQTIREFYEAPPDQPPVRGHLHTPAAPTGDALVLTHGAGSNSNAPLLVALADTFCAAGLTVLRCDLPFRQARPHGPPPRGSAERDQQGLRAAVAALSALSPGRIFLGGHSYGGRQATLLAAADPAIAGSDGIAQLLLLSYPLHPPQRPAELRTAHFPQLQTPALFVHGARDGFATFDEMTAALRLIPARTELLSIPAAGHELLTKQNRADLPATILAAFTSFADSQGTDSRKPD